MVGVAEDCGVEAAGDEQLASTMSSKGMIRSQRCFDPVHSIPPCVGKKSSIHPLLLIVHGKAEMVLNVSIDLSPPHVC